MGRDSRKCRARASTASFQSTRPVWGATYACILYLRPVIQFQSTRPVWGATLRGFILRCFTAISIHAPRMGRDLCILSERRSQKYFNPRAPYGARLASLPYPLKGSSFQSTRPVWGATSVCLSVAISIHAPRMGRDSRSSAAIIRPHDFNPRAPYGARRTHARADGGDAAISIHAPRMGRDAEYGRVKFLAEHFNPRAPYGARRGGTPVLTTQSEFQSTRPVWGATPPRTGERLAVAISIHAPRMGRDLLGMVQLYHTK